MGSAPTKHFLRLHGIKPPLNVQMKEGFTFLSWCKMVPLWTKKTIKKNRHGKQLSPRPLWLLFSQIRQSLRYVWLELCEITPWQPMFPAFFWGLFHPYIGGSKTFMFHGFGVQGYLLNANELKITPFYIFNSHHPRMLTTCPFESCGNGSQKNYHRLPTRHSHMALFVPCLGSFWSNQGYTGSL